MPLKTCRFPIRIKSCGRKSMSAETRICHTLCLLPFIPRKLAGTKKKTYGRRWTAWQNQSPKEKLYLQAIWYRFPALIIWSIRFIAMPITYPTRGDYFFHLVRFIMCMPLFRKRRTMTTNIHSLRIHSGLNSKRVKFYSAIILIIIVVVGAFFLLPKEAKANHCFLGIFGTNCSHDPPPPPPAPPPLSPAITLHCDGKYPKAMALIRDITCKDVQAIIPEQLVTITGAHFHPGVRISPYYLQLQTLGGQDMGITLMHPYPDGKVLIE